MGLLILIFGIALTLSFTILMLATSAAPQSKSMQQRLITIQQPVRSQKSDIAGAELEKIEQREYAVRLGNFLQHYKFSKKLQVLLNTQLANTFIGEIGATFRQGSPFQERKYRTADFVEYFFASHLGRHDVKLNIHVAKKRQQVRHAEKPRID